MGGWHLAVYQWRHFRAFCSWCLLTTAASFVSLAAAMPQARSSLGALGRGGLGTRPPSRSGRDGLSPPAAHATTAAG